MRNFWGYYENGKYRVGCTGGTVYIYDSENNELAKFRDVKNAYTAKFLPNTNTVVVKTTGGSLAVYSLDKLELVKKIVITRIGAQDEGFSFSPDGKYLYNIEKPYFSTQTRLTKYFTSDFKVAEILFESDKNIYLQDIEFDRNTGKRFILGFMRDFIGIYDYGFIGELINNRIENIKRLNRDTYDYIRAYKSWEMYGFTKKSMEWSRLKDLKVIVSVTLKEAFESEY